MNTNYTALVLRGEAKISHPDMWAEVLGVDVDTLRRSWEATAADAFPKK